MSRIFERLRRPKVVVPNPVRAVDRATLLRNSERLGNILRNELGGNARVKGISKIATGGAIVTIEMKAAPAVELVITVDGRVELHGGVSKAHASEYRELMLNVKRIIDKRK